ncbi:MAG: type IV secretory system conjugative DNA transfer family protein [Candidatus Peribacteria bacterium]|jgi:type IV secretory pathway TraG/TraD family ATPase VirD4|nr:type IV secretory system conjugative DNA transfer family protein [Candidatus Peribacteria bacterium]
MLVTKFQLDAMSRADIPENERVDFYLYVDEFQNFATESFATILSEARKYKLNLVMANQYIDQMQEEVKGAVFGNV